MKALVTRKVVDLIPYAQNPHTHGEAQIAQIAASIAEFGFTNPVLIDERNIIIAGHGRLLAAQKRKLDEVPCIVLPGFTEAQKAAYVIADNKLALNAGWNEKTLQAEIERLADLQYDLNLTGFSEVEIAALLEGIVTDVTEQAVEAGTALPDAGPTEPLKEWKGMPEFEQPEAGPFRTLTVHFKDQASVDEFAELIGQKLTDMTKWVWYPAAAKVKATDVYA